MIYMEPSTLTWRPLLTSYMNREFFPALNEFSKEFEAFFVFLAHACIYHVRHDSKVKYLFSKKYFIFALKFYLSTIVKRN